MTTSTLQVPQHLAALARAQAKRLASADLKREVRDGTTSIADALYDTRAGCIPVADLLMSRHRWGRTRVRKFLANLPFVSGDSQLRIAENKRVDTLSARQRAGLAEHFPCR